MTMPGPVGSAGRTAVRKWPYCPRRMLMERGDSTCVSDATAETFRVVELVPLVTPRNPPTSLPSAVALFTLTRPVVWFPDERGRAIRNDAGCEALAKGNGPLSR